MISINSYFTPFRLDLRDKKPAQLTVELSNKYEKEKNLVVEIILSRGLSLDNKGFKGQERFRLQDFKPKETKRFYLDVFAKPVANKGEHPVQIIVKEQLEGFDERYVEREFVKNVSLTIK